MRKAGARAQKEKARDARDAEARVSAMEANVAAAREDVAAAEEAASAASRVAAFAETRAEALAAMLRAKKPARRWQSARKWEDAGALFATDTDATGALGQRANEIGRPRRGRGVGHRAGAHQLGEARDLRDHLLPELVEIASWGSADVTEDDFALVRSHFVLIGGLILPHPEVQRRATQARPRSSTSTCSARASPRTCACPRRRCTATATAPSRRLRR